ncbi:MAG: tetratricopeptide repeat protein, partial [Gammaproteobacteria bacterium]|nr:tetratricopeptide repeat protein [Gammaproteobacteria bacterium]
PYDAGLEVRIRVSLGADCEAFVGEFANERYAPASLHLANVEDILFERFNPRDVFVTVRFEEPQKFEVRQTSIGWIEVFVDTLVDPATLPQVRAPGVESLQAPAETSSLPPPRRQGSSAPRPSRPAPRSAPPQVQASRTGEYVVQLGVFDDPELAIRALQGASIPHHAYTTVLDVNGRRWFGLQLGFFESEPTAQIVLDGLANRFPDAWVRFVDPDEARLALQQGDIRDGEERVAAVAVSPGNSLTPEELTEMMSAGRGALLERQYGDAIRIYTRVLRAAGHPHRAEAREMLGIAFERNGRTEEAIAEYEAFAAEFPDAIGAGRVRDRLVALQTALEPPTVNASRSPVQSRPVADEWQLQGGVSQYYWRNQEQRVHDGNYLVSSSGVLALADVSASRRGERFDLLARINGSYQFNLVEFDDTGDVGWVSDAYLDVRDNQLGLQARLGRQTRRQDGVLGRFDGFGLQYQLTPDLLLSTSAGIPVDSPRFIGDTDRRFYAASATLQGLWRDQLTASLFTHQQSVDGISDRQAVGAELYMSANKVSVFSLIDFDVSYNVLNSALVNAIWFLDNGWSLSGRVDVGAEPYLTTRNALSGQTAANVEELLGSYSEGQVRRLARDRTTQSTVVSLGLSAPLGERFDLSLDASVRQADASVASGGVAARPDTGNEVFLNATLAATSLLRDNDLLLVSIRHDSLRTRDTSRLMFDTRIPLLRSLRINPRVTVTHHSLNISDTTQTLVEPAIRILYRRGNLLLDLEAGGRWSNRELPPGEFDPFTPDGTEELLGGFVNLGYRWEF